MGEKSVFLNGIKKLLYTYELNSYKFCSMYLQKDWSSSNEKDGGEPEI
jgi:hypothetical protein